MVRFTCYFKRIADQSEHIIFNLEFCLFSNGYSRKHCYYFNYKVSNVFFVLKLVYCFDKATSIKQ